jgi:hypothetical protein
MAKVGQHTTPKRAPAKDAPVVREEDGVPELHDGVEDELDDRDERRRDEHHDHVAEGAEPAKEREKGETRA